MSSQQPTPKKSLGISAILAILILGALIGGALFTPFVYSLLLLVMGGEVDWPFSRVFDRVAMLAVLILLYLFRAHLPLAEVKARLVQGKVSDRLKKSGIGFLLSFVTSFAVLFLVVSQGDILWRDYSTSWLFGKLLKVFPAAFLISTIEEVFFRGIILSRMRQRLPFFPAALLCSCLYSMVHFIAPVKTFQYHAFDPIAGFEYLGLLFGRYGEAGVPEAMVGLFLVGMLLCYTMRRTQSLYLCVGLHAGWVFILKLARYATESAPGFAFESGIGQRYFLVAEPAAWLSLALVWSGVVLINFYFFTKIDENGPTSTPCVV